MRTVRKRRGAVATRGGKHALVPARVVKLGDLWAPLLARRGRFRLERML